MLGPTQQSLALAPNAVDVALKVMQVPNRCAGFEVLPDPMAAGKCRGLGRISVVSGLLMLRVPDASGLLQPMDSMCWTSFSVVLHN